MYLTLLGLIIFALPFFIIRHFKSSSEGFLYLSTVVAIFHLLLALISQGFHMFSYGVVVSASIVFDFVLLFIVVKRNSWHKLNIKFSFPTLVSFAVIIFLLVSVHYNYTGYVQTGVPNSSVQYVHNSSYTYPLYSDEWSAVSLIKYSIETHSLPLSASLIHNKPFINFLAAFHSLVSEVVLVLKLNPLTQYVWLAIANGLATCILVFLILRKYRIGLCASLVTILTIPFITTSGNLASILYLTPYALSFNFLLMCFLGILNNSSFVFFVNMIIALVIYPPMIVFVAPILFLKKSRELFAILKLSRIILVGLMFVIGAAVVFLGIENIQLSQLVERFVSLLVRGGEDGGAVSFWVWYVIPIFFLPFVGIGLFLVLRRGLGLLLYPTMVGVIFWSFYFLYPKVILIEKTRIVSITSILLVMTGAFGVDYVMRFLCRKHPFVNTLKIKRFARIVIPLCFMLLATFYSKINLWHKLVLVIDDTKSYTPAPPVTRYLSEGDLKVFSNINKKVFIAPRWKGLVIGVATNNYPLESKSSTITNKILLYRDFANAECSQKESYIKKYKIDYVYSGKSSCQSFKEVGQTDDNLFLYFVE